MVIVVKYTLIKGFIGINKVIFSIHATFAKTSQQVTWTINTYVCVVTLFVSSDR